MFADDTHLTVEGKSQEEIQKNRSAKRTCVYLMFLLSILELIRSQREQSMNR